MNRTISRLVASAVLLLTMMPASAVTIDTVPVGNAGNPGDTVVMHDGTSGYGAVNYSYRIGTYEVTNSQYAAFLNAVASHIDPYDLYSVFMEFGSRGGIKPTFSPGAVNYVTKPGMENMPVNYVSWGSAARFANWLHNGQPTGAEDASTTERGAYTLDGATTDAALAAVTRNASAQWFLPTENEWYKAAYHANNGVTGSYSLYPTASNIIPLAGAPPGGANSANHSNAVGTFTAVGSYINSPSAYGTFDQGGNAMEWNETYFAPYQYRGVRGGFYGVDGGLNPMNSGLRGLSSPGSVNEGIGFRVATVPEPSSFVLVALGLMGLVVWRLRKRSWR